MARFQAQTNAVLGEELEELRRCLGLRSNQKADLLRELTGLASWVVHQAIEGRAVIARGEDGVRELVHPVIERLRQLRSQGSATITRLHLSDEETRRLAEILDHGFDPQAALVESLKRLADPGRKAPDLTWNDGPE
ncbi:MAG: hypothetical protein GY856_33420 [bacterium]|nr:hypothetical protein [bacterium]